MLNIKIIIAGLIAAGMVSLLYAIVPITDAFIISHIFTMIAILGICISLCFDGIGNSKTIAKFSYAYTAVIYAIISIIFSVIACLLSLPFKWTLVIHIIIIALFVIRIIVLSAGNGHIRKTDSIFEQKHNEFLDEKKNYWK